MIQVEQYLSNFYKGNKKPTLDGMQYFMEQYNNFEKEMKFIHIAGTTGKGSCTEMISNILEKQGYKVGKFLSPHLIKYNERISINGKQISDEEMLEIIKELEPKIEKYNAENSIKITLFELETIMALLYFYRRSVDFVVLETGLGGIYDCTNIISNTLVSVITSIGYDHTHILGKTLSEIASQKAGIIKENSNTVHFANSQVVNDVFIRKCKMKNNRLHLIEKGQIKNYYYNDEYQYFDYGEMKNIAINLKGEKQIENASICIETMKILNKLGYVVDEQNIRKGLSTVVHRGRMETINSNPLIVFDGAHNVLAIENLQKSVKMYYKDMKRIYIVSILKRKDYKKMLSLLMQDKNASFIFTSGNNERRYVSSDELYEITRENGGTNICKMSLEQAIDVALKTSKDTVNLIVGSFYVYGTVIEYMQTKK